MPRILHAGQGPDGEYRQLGTLLAGIHRIGLERMPVCALYHTLELWDWFASAGHRGPLDDLAGDLRAIVGV